MSSRLGQYLQSSQNISDRVALVRFAFGKSVPSIDVIIAYGPTSPRCAANPILHDHFYQQLQLAVGMVPKRSVLIVMGDLPKLDKEKLMTVTHA